MFTFEDLIDAVHNELSYELDSCDSVWKEHFVLGDALDEWKREQSLSDDDVLDEDKATDLIQGLASYLKEYEEFENTPIYTSDIHDIWNKHTNACEEAFFSVMNLEEAGGIADALSKAVDLFCDKQARETLYDASEKMSSFELTLED